MPKKPPKLDEMLRAAVRESGLSILQVSKRSDVPYSATHRFLTGGGNVTIASAVKIANALGLEVVLKLKGR